MKTEVTWIRDVLHGDDAYELQVKLLKQVPEEYPYKDDEWWEKKETLAFNICLQFLL